MTYTLTGSNGEVIVFDNTNYVLNPGLTGFGIPPTSVRVDESARPGGVWRSSRRSVRQVDLPVTVLGSSATSVESKLRTIARAVQDNKGPTVLTAVRSTGNLTLELHYTGGAELSYGGDTGGQSWAKLVLSFVAPQPYWQSASRQTFTITSGNTGRGLLPQLTKLKLSSSLSLGTINVNNTGDVPVYPTYTVEGPINNFRVTSGELSFGFNTALTGDDVITVDTEAGTVTDADGNNRYDLLATSPKLFPFEVGNSTIVVEGTGTTLDTKITATYSRRFEVVHG